MNPLPCRLGRAVLVLAIGLSLLAATACAGLQALFARPEVRAVSLTVTRLDLRQLHLLVAVHVANDAAAPVTITDYAYQLEIDGQPFLQGVSERGVELAPRAVTTIQIPVAISLSDLLQKLKRFRPESDLPYRFSATLRLDTMFGGRAFSFQKDGRLQPLLR